MQAEAVAAYLRVREREGRLLPDTLVRDLPLLPPGHPLAGEWRRRAASAGRLAAYLRQRAGGRGPLTVLEVGCGNGWLAARLAEALPLAQVLGLDANAVELDQARRVFADRPNLWFELGDAESDEVPEGPFEVVVVASAVQYLADLPTFLQRMTTRLAARGEIHLLDSPLYGRDELEGARRRTAAYYAAVGVPAMAAHYHHHAWDELQGFTIEVLYRPPSGLWRAGRAALGRPDSPFPWLRIRPEAGPG